MEIPFVTNGLQVEIPFVTNGPQVKIPFVTNGPQVEVLFVSDGPEMEIARVIKVTYVTTDTATGNLMSYSTVPLNLS